MFRIPKKRWMRISLLAMMVAMTGLAIAFAWVSNEVRRCRAEDEAVTWLRNEYPHPTSIGFGNRFDHVDEGSIIIVPNSTEGPPWLARMLGVDIWRTVKSVSVLAPGNTLNYEDSTGEWLPSVKYTSGLGSEELKHILAFRYLKSLDLSWHPIDDEGVHQLCQLDSLQSLGLGYTKVTDDAARYLNRLRQLKTLGLQHTKVSKGAVDRLGDSLPNCEIGK